MTQKKIVDLMVYWSMNIESFKKFVGYLRQKPEQKPNLRNTYLSDFCIFYTKIII